MKAAYIASLILAAALDIYANIMMARSEGFKKKKEAFTGILFVCLAFTCMAFAIRGLNLAVAYALWGAFGVLGTSIFGWLLFKQKLNTIAWVGIVLLLSGLAILQFS